MPITQPFIPLRLLIPWPEDRFPLPQDGSPSLLDVVGLQSFSTSNLPDGKRVSVGIAILKEVKLGIDAVEGLEVVFGGNDGITTLTAELLVGKSVSLTLNDIRVALRLPTSWVKRMRRAGEVFEEDRDGEGRLRPYEVALEGLSITIDFEGNINFNFAIDAPAIDLDPFMISDSGVVVEAENISFVFSQEAADSIPSILPSARGIFIDEATIYLPKDISVALPSNVQLDDLFIGSGGFSGRISGTWTPTLNTDATAFAGNGAGDIFGIPFALKEVAIEFKQNTLVGSTIKGAIILPFFDQPVMCEVGLTNDGDFTVALSADQTLPAGVSAPRPTADGLFVFTKEDLLELKLKSIAFEKKADVFSIQLGGDIKPLFGGIDWPEFEIKALTIDSTGKVKIDGGWIEIPKQKSFDFNGFKVELTKLGFGTEADGSKWIGLSGGIQLVEGIPLKGAVEGLKIIWTDPFDPTKVRVSISGIEVAFEVEDVLKFQGKVFFIDEPGRKGFGGGVKMVIYPLDGLKLDAQFMTGRNTLAQPYNFFYIYMGLELPVGIPLGSTGASLYGMAGLFGYNVLPDKRDNEQWFENDDGSAGFYLRDEVGITPVSKWTDSRESLALGAGITLGTADNGFTFAGKILLVVLIPGPIILIEGKAQFLKERGNLDEEAIFRLLAILDFKSGTFLLNVQARYKLPDDGKVLDISGIAEVYFNFNNPSAWHLYIGQDTPEAKRIRADILQVFKANTFFMIDANGVLMGFWVGYKNRWKFGPLSVSIEAWMEGRLGLNWKPVQAYGMFALFGDVQLKAFGIGIGLTVFAMMEVKTPKPFLIHAELRVKLNLPWPLPDPKATIVLEWKDPIPPDIPLPLAKIGIEHPKVTDKWDLVKIPDYDTEKDGFEGGFSPGNPLGALYSSPLVPPDAFPALSFAKPVKDELGVGKNPADPLGAESVGKYQFEYNLKSITLERRRKDGPSTWAPVDSSTITGEWQAVPGEPPENTKLLLWANTPFELSRDLESNESIIYSTLDGPNWSGYPCNLDVKPRFTCVDFDALPLKTAYYEYLLKDDLIFNAPGAKIAVVRHKAQWTNTDKALKLLWDNKPKAALCINISGAKKAKNRKKIVIDNVVFSAAILPSGNPTYITVGDRYPDPGDGKNEVFIGWSENEGNNGKYAAIHFPTDKFPDAPDKVAIKCLYWNDRGVTLVAYDGHGKKLGSAKHTSQQDKLITLTLSYPGIRKIEIIGSEILITELCLEFSGKQDEAPLLNVVFPDEVCAANLYLAQKSEGTVRVFGKDGGVLWEEDFMIQSKKPVSLSVKDKLMHAVEISGEFLLLKVCTLTEEEAQRAGYNEWALRRIKETSSEFWSEHTNYLLEPNSYYKLTVVTETKYLPPGGGWVSKTFTESVYFQTGNPPGAFTPTVPTAGEVIETPGQYPEGGALVDLGPYIERTVPAGGAANEPQVPAYRSYDVGVIFNEPQGYVEQMYLMAGLPITVRLFDNNEEPVLGPDGLPVVVLNSWSDNPELRYRREDWQWRAVLAESSCAIDFSALEDVHTSNLYAGSRDLVLKPRSLYRARLCGGQYELYGFSFVTSAYCTFIHHIHSFNDLAWDYHRLYGTAGTPLLDGTGKNNLKDALSAFSSKLFYAPGDFDTRAEAVAFEDIATVFNLGARSLPEGLEVSVLDDDDFAYGLLLESPEPIDWHRVTMGMKHSRRKVVLPEAEANIKIIDATIDASSAGGADYNSEYVDILLRESMDMSGLRVEHRRLTDPEDGVFTEYYLFNGLEGVRPAGTVMRVHSGKPPATDDSDKEPLHRYRTEAGGVLNWSFDPAGEEIRITDSDDKVLHTRTVTPLPRRNKRFILVRNADMTRAFVFLPLHKKRISHRRNPILELTALTEGRYRLSFNFKREIGRQETLKRMGSTADENTYIEFNLPALLPEG